MRVVTIRDVAKAARVSVKTVSRVLNEEAAVHPSTRAHVQQVIQDLHFRPNPLARSLVAQRTRTLGLVVPDVSNPFFAPAVYGCAAMAEQKGYHLVVDTGGSAEAEARHIRALLEQRVSGVILWTSALSEEAIRALIAQVHRASPMVFVDCGFAAAWEPHTRWRPLHVEQHRVGVLATQHLLTEGRQRVAHLAHNNWAGRQRHDGYRDALATQQPRGEAWVAELTHVSIQGGALATRALLEQRPYPDSIFAYNDAVAVGAVLACRKRNLRVPEDIAIVGVDDTEMAAVIDPPLTTIRIYQRETGEQATALLLGLIEDEAPSGGGGGQDSQGPVVPPPRLIVRRSSTLRAAPDATLDELLDVTHGAQGRSDR